ncbi:MAG: hypothetical protein K2O18_08335 [Oscillospiraceae bacterium]|nr:hypothetical protein [Oscillospiraceae bacterium]
MFHPEHFPPETWSRHKQEGYKLRKFLPLAPQRIAEMDAEVFLREGRGFFMTSPGINVNDESCVLAKIFAPDGRAVCLRLDRDYFEIYVRDANGSDSAAVWQFGYTFRDYRQDELWSNMVTLLCRHQTLTVDW